MKKRELLKNKAFLIIKLNKNEIFASLSDQLYFNQLADKLKLFLGFSIKRMKEKHFRNKESVLQVFKLYTAKKRNEFNESVSYA
jgi:hypothetical protein